MDEGSRSTARIESVFEAPKGDFTQVSLLILDGDAQGWTVRVSLDRDTTAARGDEVEVAYEPDDPGDLVIVGEESAPNNGLAIGAWILAAGVAIAFAWQDHRSRSRTTEPLGG